MTRIWSERERNCPRIWTNDLALAYKNSSNAMTAYSSTNYKSYSYIFFIFYFWKPNKAQTEWVEYLVRERSRITWRTQSRQKNLAASGIATAEGKCTDQNEKSSNCEDRQWQMIYLYIYVYIKKRNEMKKQREREREREGLRFERWNWRKWDWPRASSLLVREEW